MDFPRETLWRLLEPTKALDHEDISYTAVRQTRTRMQRRVTLPTSLLPMRSSWSLQAEALFHQLYRGNFVAEWSHSFSEHDATPLQDASPICDERLRHINPRLTITVYAAAVPGGEYKDVLCLQLSRLPDKDPGCNHRCNYSYPSSLELTENQETALKLRAIHHFYRVTGCDIGITPSFVIDAALIEYARNGWWKEHLDAEVIGADVMVQTMQNDFMCMCNAVLHELGHALSACAKYGIEAEIYEHMRNAYGNKCPDKTIPISAMINQGRAYGRLHDFDLEEATYVEAAAKLLEALGDDAGVKHNNFSRIMNNFLNSYQHRVCVEFEEPGDYYLPSGAFHSTLNAILSVSGLYNSEAPAIVSLLKRRLQKRKAARQAVLDALRSDSVELYREAVNSWTTDSEKRTIRIHPDHPPASSDAIRKEAKITARKAVRKYYNIETSLPCSNPDCSLDEVEIEDLLQCGRCKTTLYCSRKCQVAHWNAWRWLHELHAPLQQCCSMPVFCINVDRCSASVWCPFDWLHS